MNASIDVTEPADFTHLLADAERLLYYAAENGVDVDATTRGAILDAKDSPATPQIINGVLVALTTLTAKLKPVTGDSLRASTADGEGKEIAYLWRWTKVLAIIIIPFSIVSFIASGISDAIRADIKTANELAVKLTTRFPPDKAASAVALDCKGESSAPVQDTPAAAEATPPPADSVTDAQQFAGLIRDIYGKSVRLNYFVFGIEKNVDPFRACRQNAAKQDALHDILQLPTNLPSQMSRAVSQKVYVYQDVRYFAQSLLDDTSLSYGALEAVALPVLYALLGALAYLLRTFDVQTREKTYVPSDTESARFIIAGVSGGVVGLFANSGLLTAGSGSTIPPLALAFLVGYAVDVFFSFLEGLLKSFGNSKTSKT